LKLLTIYLFLFIARHWGMTVPRTLASVLDGRFNSLSLVERRKRDLLNRAEVLLKEMASSLGRDGRRIKYVKSGILLDDRYLIFLAEKIDPILIERLSARYSPEEMFLICWYATESAVALARERRASLLILSRAQVLRADTDFSKAILKFWEEEGFQLEDFSSLSSEESAFDQETFLLAELIALREFYRKEVLRSLDSKVLELLDELEEMVVNGADETEMNKLLIAVLEAYPAEIDERNSAKPGKPDVIVHSPLWTLFELKNEEANRSHVDQTRKYANEYRGDSRSPLGVPWRAVLVATRVSPDTHSYALKKGVRTMSWESLIGFLRDVYSRGVPLELLRESLESTDLESALASRTEGYLKSLEARAELLREVLSVNGIDRGELEKIVASKGYSWVGELERMLIELSGPLIGFLIVKKDLVSYRGPHSIRRALRALRHLGGMVDASIR